MSNRLNATLYQHTGGSQLKFNSKSDVTSTALARNITSFFHFCFHISCPLKTIITRSNKFLILPDKQKDFLKEIAISEDKIKPTNVLEPFHKPKIAQWLSLAFYMQINLNSKHD